MILERELARRYALVVVASLAVLGALIYHEFVTEPRQRRALGVPDMRETQWREDTEVYFYWMLPLVLVCGWVLLRRTLRPIKTMTEAIGRAKVFDLSAPLSRLRYDEMDQLAAAFDKVRARLHEWSQHTRQFTLHASHELKTPLTVMGIQFETMLREDKSLSPQQVEWVECQLDEVQRLGKIVDDLTLLIKADAGLMKLEHQTLDFSELVHESFEDAQILGEPNQIDVVLGECAEVVMMGDRHRLRQLLLNLVDNAIKYNWPGGVVTLSLRRVENAAQLEITNTGEGIPTEMHERVFERFVRGDQARSQAIEGSGLGLSICRWIVEAHHGTISLSSQSGRTTTVQVLLPLPDHQPLPDLNRTHRSLRSRLFPLGST